MSFRRRATGDLGLAHRDACPDPATLRRHLRGPRHHRAAAGDLRPQARGRRRPAARRRWSACSPSGSARPSADTEGIAADRGRVVRPDPARAVALRLARRDRRRDRRGARCRAPAPTTSPSSAAGPTPACSRPCCPRPGPGAPDLAHVAAAGRARRSRRGRRARQPGDRRVARSPAHRRPDRARSGGRPAAGAAGDRRRPHGPIRRQAARRPGDPRDGPPALADGSARPAGYGASLDGRLPRGRRRRRHAAGRRLGGRGHADVHAPRRATAPTSGSRPHRDPPVGRLRPVQRPGGAAARRRPDRGRDRRVAPDERGVAGERAPHPRGGRVRGLGGPGPRVLAARGRGARHDRRAHGPARTAATSTSTSACSRSGAGPRTGSAC